MAEGNGNASNVVAKPATEEMTLRDLCARGAVAAVTPPLKDARAFERAFRKALAESRWKAGVVVENLAGQTQVVVYSLDTAVPASVASDLARKVLQAIAERPSEGAPDGGSSNGYSTESLTNLAHTLYRKKTKSESAEKHALVVDGEVLLTGSEKLRTTSTNTGSARHRNARICMAWLAEGIKIGFTSDKAAKLQQAYVDDEGLTNEQKELLRTALLPIAKACVEFDEVAGSSGGIHVTGQSLFDAVFGPSGTKAAGLPPRTRKS